MKTWDFTNGNGKRKAAARQGRYKLYKRKRWLVLRKYYLAKHPICVDPWRDHGDLPVPATEVDHVVEVALRPDLMYSTNNMQALCHRCHARKSGRYSALKRPTRVGGVSSGVAGSLPERTAPCIIRH